MAREIIIATADIEKIVFVRHGEKMWTRTRYEKGKVVYTGRVSTKSVEGEISLLDGWTIERPTPEEMNANISHYMARR